VQAIHRLINGNPSFIDAAATAGFFALPIWSAEPYGRFAFSFLTHLLTLRPEFLTLPMRPLVQLALDHAPERIALLFGYFWLDFSRHPQADTAALMLLEFGRALVESSAAKKLIVAACHGIRRSQTFRQRWTREIAAFFGAFFQARSVEVVLTAYSIVTSFLPTDNFCPPIDGILQHVSVGDLQWAVVSLILRLPTLPVGNDDLFASLYAAAQSARLGFFGLCRLAECGEVNAFLRFPVWMIVPLPTFLETFRLLILLARYQSFRTGVIQCAEFGQLLAEIVQLGEKAYIIPIASLIKRLPLDANAFALLESSGFLSVFFGLGISTPDVELAFTVLASVPRLTEIGFSVLYLHFVPRIVEFLREENQMTGGAMQVLVLISQFAAAGDYLKENQLDEYFRALLAVPGYEALAHAFLVNLERPPK
jgi:hypothetical protein